MTEQETTPGSLAPEKLSITKTLVKAWKQFCRTWWILPILIALAFGGLFARQQLTHVDVYEAYASFSVSVNSRNSGMSNFNTRVSLKQLGESFPYILESGALKKVVMEDIGVSYLPESITARVVSNTSLFRISVRGQDPERAVQVLDSVIENYPRVAKYVIGKTALTMLDYSGVPTTPINAVSTSSLIRSAVLFGTAVYLLILFGLILTRRTVSGEADLSPYTSLRCLSAIPYAVIKRRSQKAPPKLLIDQRYIPQSFSEAVNLLRIRTKREMGQHEEKVLLITSTGEGEGKSSVASNLALSCALNGDRVLLIDGDLRNPSVAAQFSIKPTVGLGDVLSGKGELSRAVTRYKETSLDILPGRGAMKASGISALLGSSRMNQLLRAARERYDLVIVDSPPCGMLRDAMSLARFCDASIAVIRQDFIARTRILETLELLSDTGSDLLGFVINGEDGSVGSYGYGRYGYGSSYGYGKYGNYGKYGYGAKSSSSKKKS